MLRLLENPKQTLNGDFSKDIFVLVWFFGLVFFCLSTIKFDLCKRVQIMLRKYLGSCSVAALCGVPLPGHPSRTPTSISSTMALQNHRDTTQWLIADAVLMNIVLRCSQTAKPCYLSPKYP